VERRAPRKAPRVLGSTEKNVPLEVSFFRGTQASCGILNIPQGKLNPRTVSSKKSKIFNDAKTAGGYIGEARNKKKRGTNKKQPIVNDNLVTDQRKSERSLWKGRRRYCQEKKKKPPPSKAKKKAKKKDKIRPKTPDKEKNDTRGERTKAAPKKG